MSNRITALIVFAPFAVVQRFKKRDGGVGGVVGERTVLATGRLTSGLLQLMHFSCFLSGWIRLHEPQATSEAGCAIAISDDSNVDNKRKQKPLTRYQAADALSSHVHLLVFSYYTLFMI
ncbi:MAG: hypothetical protein Q7S54_01385 [bacterium]|nr:hypothetical protein [bacterium]